MLREELRQRLTKDYRYAATKMQETSQPARKIFHFSIIFAEAQSVLNWEWNRDIALIYAISFHTHAQINAATQVPAQQALPTDWTAIFDKLTLVTSDLAAYFEKSENDIREEELQQILGSFAEITYVVSGNGSYLHEKGLIEF